MSERAATVVITGGSSGLGFATARALLAQAEDDLVLGCRSTARGEQAVRELEPVARQRRAVALALDLASLASVRRFAHELTMRGRSPIRALVCNAGVQVVSGRARTEDGFEKTFAVNHLGHFLLVNLLLPHLAPRARIVFVSSGTHDPARRTGLPAPRLVDADLLAHPERDPHAPDEDAGTAGRRAYATSKLCNILCAYELARRLQERPDGRGSR